VAELAQYKRERIALARDTVKAALCSTTYSTYATDAIEAIDYYEGRQWTQEDTDKLPKGIRAYTSNLIAPRLDAVAGKEVSTRVRFKFKGRSGNKDEELQAESISALAMWLQERNRTSRLLSEAKHQARISGLGWHGFDVVDGQITERIENPLEVIWDTRDTSALLDNQGFVARVKWMPLEEAQRRFPKRADELAMCVSDNSDMGLGFSVDVPSRLKLHAFNSYWNEKDKEVAIIEYQYREPATFYRATTKNGLVFDTFDRDEAEEYAVSKKAVVENEGFKVCVAYYAGSIDLDWFESPYQINPRKGLFTLTPVVFARGMLDGVPYGLVKKAIDPQRLYNIKQSKINWLMAARGVQYQKGAFDDPNTVANEINNPSYFIEVNGGKEVKIETHTQEIAQHYQALAMHKAEIEQVMGIYDEALGVETNAQSGVAIQKRQTASGSTQIYSNDGFAEAQRDIADKMLGLIRITFTGEMTLNITDDEGQVKSISLNQETEDGRLVDIRMGEYNVVMENIPDSDTMNDLAREFIMELVRSGVRLEQITSGWLDLMNVPKTATLRKEIEQGVQQKLQELEQIKAQQQKLANGPQGQTQMPAGATGQQTPMGAM
jgi:hypothetical protein